jgi:hypothetical protein
MRFCALLEVPRGLLWHFWKFLVGFCELFEVNHGILCIFRRSSWDFVHAQNPTRFFRKCTKSHEELPKMHKIPGETSKIFVSSSRDFVQFWMFLVGFCAFLEVPRGIVHI